jgi:hypothetical protein
LAWLFSVMVFCFTMASFRSVTSLTKFGGSFPRHPHRQIRCPMNDNCGLFQGGLIVVSLRVY